MIRLRRALVRPIFLWPPFRLMVSLGGNLNAASRQALMHKLARIDSAPITSQPEYAIFLWSSFFH